MGTELDLLVPEWAALIDEFGLPAVFHVDVGAADPATSTWVPVITDVTRNVTPPACKRLFRTGEAATTDQTLTYLGALNLPFTPKPGLRLTIDGREYTTVEATAIYGGTLVHVWELAVE